MTLNAFMASVDETISLRHVPSHCTDKAGVRKLVDEDEKLVLSSKPHAAWLQFECTEVKFFYCHTPAFCQRCPEDLEKHEES